MIYDLEKRRQGWNQRKARAPYDTHHDMTDSLPYPFENAGIYPIFCGRDVLEIGPGNGRQYERLSKKAKSYCIADIAPNGLAESVFRTATEKFLLEDWNQNLGRTFDVIHFWYVLHHIRLGEMPDFFSFVHRHLKSGGLAAFNCPMPINVTGAPEGDGFGTTYSDPMVVQNNCRPLNILMSLPIGQKSNGYVFLLQRKYKDSENGSYDLEYMKQVIEDRNIQRLEESKAKAMEERKQDTVGSRQAPTSGGAIIHFIHNIGNDWQIACMPHMKGFSVHSSNMRTDSPLAVTCAACMESNIFNDRISSAKAWEAVSASGTVRSSVTKGDDEAMRLMKHGLDLYKGAGGHRKIPFTHEGVNFVRDVFIETGIETGYTTIHALKSGFKECHTIDINPSVVRRAKMLFSGLKGITAYEGDSRKILTKVIDPTRPTTFWLDAHGKGGEGREGDDQPLLDELNIIQNTPWLTPPYVMIDDGGYNLTVDDIKKVLIGHEVKLWSGDGHSNAAIIYCAPKSK